MCLNKNHLGLMPCKAGVQFYLASLPDKTLLE
jgi:hypothetical protein